MLDGWMAVVFRFVWWCYITFFLAYRPLDKIEIIRCWSLSPVLLMGKTFRDLEKT